MYFQNTVLFIFGRVDPMSCSSVHPLKRSPRRARRDSGALFDAARRAQRLESNVPKVPLANPRRSRPNKGKQNPAQPSAALCLPKLYSVVFFAHFFTLAAFVACISRLSRRHTKCYFATITDMTNIAKLRVMNTANTRCECATRRQACTDATR